jgi:hypothetical protein
MPTTAGLVLLPLSLLWLNQPLRLLQLALVAAVFEAAAAVIVGGTFGLPLAMVPGLLFILYVVGQYLLGMRYPGEGLVLRAAVPLLLLLGYALLSVVLLPGAFEGKIMVVPQKLDPSGEIYVPLAFNAGNVTQSLYLTMNVGMAIVVALFVTRAAISYRSILRAYLLGGYVAVGIAFWQFASRVAGVPFPNDVFYSNSGWAIVEQALGAVPRIQGPFSEPAGLAFYLSGLCFCCLWLCVRGHRLMRPELLLALAMLAMFLSTSTTGLVALGGGLPLVLLFAARKGDVKALGRSASTVVGLAVASAVALAPVLILKPDLLDSVSAVVEQTLSKTDSDSYEERSLADQMALATVGQTSGLGVGWGSFRSSSLVPGLLANAGVFGLAMVLWMAARLSRLAARAAVASRGHPGQVLVDGFSAALCGQLAAALLSAPTIGSLAFFLQLGCVIGAAARITIDSRSPARLRAAWPQPAAALPPRT